MEGDCSPSSPATPARGWPRPAPARRRLSQLTRRAEPGAQRQEAAGGGGAVRRREAEPADEPDERQPPVPRPAAPGSGGGSGRPEPARRAAGRHLGPRAALRMCGAAGGGGGAARMRSAGTAPRGCHVRRCGRRGWLGPCGAQSLVRSAAAACGAAEPCHTCLQRGYGSRTLALQRDRWLHGVL